MFASHDGQLSETGFVTLGEAAPLVQSLELLLNELGQAFTVVLVKFVETVGYSDIFLKPPNSLKTNITRISCQSLVAKM